MLMEDGKGLGNRLEGIRDATAQRIAIALARLLHERLTPSAIDEIRNILDLAVRAAALEGARSHHETSSALVEGRLTKPGFSKKTRAAKVIKPPPKGAF